MSVRVQYGTHYSLGVEHTVSRVNSRSFYVSSGGVVTRLLLAEWSQWLHKRLAEGRVLIDGVAWVPSASECHGTVAVDVAVRGPRFLRAANDVMKRYRFSRVVEGALVRVEVVGGERPYTVEAWTDWRDRARCTCPDALRPAVNGYCKHVIAVLLGDAALRCQLLDVLL